MFGSFFTKPIKPRLLLEKALQQLVESAQAPRKMQHDPNEQMRSFQGKKE
jgi:hypothetical protein